MWEARTNGLLESNGRVAGLRPGSLSSLVDGCDVELIGDALAELAGFVFRLVGLGVTRYRHPPQGALDTVLHDVMCDWRATVVLWGLPVQLHRTTLDVATLWLARLAWFLCKENIPFMYKMCS